VDYVEIDLRLTRDGHVVVLHDAKIDRTTNGHGRIKDLTLTQLKRIKTKDGQHVPTLEDVLKLTDGRVGLMLELKVRRLATRVTQIVQQSGFKGPVIYASFNHTELARVRQVLPKAKILALFQKGPIRPKVLVSELRPTLVGIRFDRVTKRLVHAVHTVGLMLIVYTVNDSGVLLLMRDIEVDGVISDYPDLLTSHSNFTV
jgi:glycerophosphoryl diester phosphodiesterase